MIERVIEIKDQLINNEIHWEDAFSKLKEIGPGWGSKYWKNVREVLIQDHCEQCGSNEEPFVLQHLRQMPNLTDLAREIRKPYYQKYIKDNPIRFGFACPDCESTNIWPLTNKNTWECRSGNHEEGFNFDLPLILDENYKADDVYVDRKVCPHCNSTAIRYRKSDDKWICESRAYNNYTKKVNGKNIVIKKRCGKRECKLNSV